MEVCETHSLISEQGPLGGGGGGLVNTMTDLRVL
jgi:hypothetical protein